MKLLTSILSILILASTTMAQSSDNKEPIYASQLKFEAASKNLILLNRKFEFYGGASVLFNSNAIQIRIEKPSNCDATICPAIAAEPQVINLKVVKVIEDECEDIYYANNSDSVKNGEVGASEHVVLRNTEVNRCPSLIKKEDGSLRYKIVGHINEKQVEAQGLFSLKNVRELSRNSK